jgi:hypothetical protein
MNRGAESVPGEVNLRSIPTLARLVRRVELSRMLGLVLVALSATACARMQLRSPIAATEGPPTTFALTTSDLRTTRVIDVRDGLTKAVAFRAATDFLAQRFSIDVSDQHAGFLMTPWQSSSTREGMPDLRYRTRIIIRFLGEDWKQLAVRAEANWQRGDQWDIGYDSKLLDDVATEFRNRIGKQM